MHRATRLLALLSVLCAACARATAGAAVEECHDWTTVYDTDISTTYTSLYADPTLTQPAAVAINPARDAVAVVSDERLLILDLDMTQLAANDSALAGQSDCGLSWDASGLWVACAEAGVSVARDWAPGGSVAPVPVCAWPGAGMAKRWADSLVVVFATADASPLGCSVVLVPADSLDCDAAACFNDALTDAAYDALGLADNATMLVTLPSRDELLVVTATDSSAVTATGAGVLLNPGWVVDGSAWNYSAVVLNSGWDAGSGLTLLSGVTVNADGSADATPLFGTDALDGGMGLSAIAGDFVLIANYDKDSLVQAFHCTSFASAGGDDDDDAGDDALWLTVGGFALAGAAAVVVLGLSARRVRQRSRRRKETALVEQHPARQPLLSGAADLVTPEGNWLLDLSLVERGKLIGSGATGNVFEGRLRGCPVAIKRIPLNFDAGWLERVRVESRTLARLQHPYVLRCFGLAVDEKAYQVFLVTERCATSLQAVIGDGDFDRLKVARQVAEAFVYLHSCGVVHRDLKPDNVLLDDGGDVRVADFGECRDFGAEGTFAATAMTGTVGYMAPELIADDAAYHGGACDVYSFGVVLNSLATRRRPFLHIVETSETAMLDVLRATVAGERPSLSSSVSPEYNALVEACWAQEPRERPRFGEVLERLGSVGAGGLGSFLAGP